MLLRKLWRDIKDNYGAYLAVISVIVIGLMLYVSLSITADNVQNSLDNYYVNTNFADGFAQIVKGPINLPKDLENIKGIHRVEGRIVKDILVYKPTGEETTTLRLISIEKSIVNKLRQENGRPPRARANEILVTPAFLQGNKLNLGDEIPLIIFGNQVKFTITGTANNPEYIYEVPNGGTLAPNPKNFGIAFVPYATIAPLLGMDGAINDLVFTLEKSTNFTDVKVALNRVLDQYGLTQLFARKDQFSFFLVTQKLTGLKAAATTTPVMFLFVAASILYIMLRRMVEQQRGQIGILKAFGFSDKEIMLHYLSYGVIIGFCGGLGGGLAGGAFSYTLAQLYRQYFNIPGISGSFSLNYILTGTIVSVLFGVFSGFQGAKKVLAYSPSEAMRPPAPKVVGKTLFERVNFIWHLLDSQGKMAIRNIFRSKQRSMLAVLGVAAAFSMMIASGASFSASDLLISFQFDKVEKYDLKVSLNSLADIEEAVTSAKHVDGVQKAEPYLEVPATLSHKWLQKDVAIIGLPNNAELYHLVTNAGNVVTLPADGVVISEQLSKVLNLHVGDLMNVKPYIGEKREVFVKIQQIVPQYVGLGAYMNIKALSKMLQTHEATSAILLKVDKEKLPSVRKDLQQAKNVFAIYDKTKVKTEFEQLMASSKSSMFVILFFAFLTGFAIVYNVTLISLSERERELTTLLILGMTEREVGRILIYEQSALSLFGVLIGIPLSYAMMYAIASGASSDLYNIPIMITSQSFIIGFVGIFAVLLVAQWKIKGKINNLSMLDILKEQE